MGTITRRRVASGLIAVLALGGIGGSLVAVPAFAASETAVLNIVKSVDKTSVVPGNVFTYTIAVECSSDNCPEAQVVDVLPPEFDALTLTPNVAITGAPASYDWSGPNGRTLTVDFTRPLDIDGDGTADPGVVGLASGDGPSIQVTLTVPSSLSPDWPSNGATVTNSASVTASTAASVSDTADVVVTVPYVVATTCTVDWSPSTAQFKVGELSTLTLTTRNTSNALADRLELALPTDVSGAGNLFDTVNLSAFGDVVLPQGADLITVDAYVAGTWHLGTPSATAELPAGVAAADVTGLRIRFTASGGTTLVAGGTAGSVEVLLAQRAWTRATSTPLVSGASVTAQVTGTVAVPGHGTQSATGSDGFVIGPLTSIVTGSTSFQTARIPAGTGTVAMLRGSNGSNGPLASLTLTQPADQLFADGRVRFGGFGSTGAAWPTGATGATVTWLVDTGVAPSPSPFAQGDSLPAVPALAVGQHIIGFSVEYTGAIAVGAEAIVPMRVDVASDAVTQAEGEHSWANQIAIDGLNDAGAAPTAHGSASLTALFPQLDVTLAKSVTPSKAVPAGGRSVVQLRATTGTDTGFVSPTSILITDVTGGTATEYWEAFDAVAVAPTQIPAGATLTIEGTTDGGTWTVIDTQTAGAVGVLYQDTLPAGLVGIRFRFENSGGFAQGTTVQANIAFIARATLRSSGLPPASLGSNVSYLNRATVDAEGEVTGSGPITANAANGASGEVKELPGGSGGLLLRKEWQAVSGSVTVPSQSRQTRVARLLWGTEVSGYGTAVVTDPADPTAPVSQTVFQNFDLRRIEAITTAIDPYIAYDQVSNVELYNGTSWTSVYSTACATLSNCQGQFAGYTLTTAQRASTVAVRITFAPWAAGRTTDPLAPPIDAGVASGPEERQLNLTFGLRNRLRDASATPTNPWITGARVYNNTDPGSVLNTARLHAGAFDATAQDDMLILDVPPAITLVKTASTSSIPIPVTGDVPAASYPVVAFALTATNTSAANAWYLRVTDVAPCTIAADCVNPTVGGISGSTINPYTGKTWDPATSPFDKFSLYRVRYTLPANSGIDAASSTVTLWRLDGTSYSTQTIALNDARLSDANAATFLADVIGVSALFRGADLTDGGTIVSGAAPALTLDTRLRQNLRSDPGTKVPPGTVVNTAFAQVWDGVLDDTVASAYTTKSASVTLGDAALDVATSKTLNPTTLLEKDRANDVTVTLGANQGSATASPAQLVIEDSAAAFWNSFEFRGFNSFTFPSGANRVRVDALVAGTWYTGTAAASPALPTLPLGVTTSAIAGLRFTFTHATNPIFSTAAPAANWSASAPFKVGLRSAYLDSGAPIVFPSTVPNSVSTTVTNPTWGSDSATASASIALDPGTFRVAISKTPAVATSPAGETVDWTLVMTNTGTGYLNNPVVTDLLPKDAGLLAGGALLFDPTSELVYSTSAGGILPLTGQTVTYDDTARTLTIAWPAGSRLAPGESYTVKIPLQLAPGLQASYGAATNTFRFASDRTLAACTLATANGRPTPTRSGVTCTTDNVISAVSASAISSFKGVKGDVDALGNSTRGAVNVGNAATPCASDAQGFYRSPCAANTVIGGEDLWKLRFTNGGNIPATTATVVDVLPRPGDAYLISGISRASSYRPQFAGSLALTTDALSAGTTMTWQVTTTANPCPNYSSNSACTGATWSDGPSFDPADYGQVTAIRIVFDFSALPSSKLPPAATLTVNYRTLNVPSTTAGDQRAPVTAPVTDARAWNSFGVWASFDNATQRRVEPIRAGVQLESGPLQVTKVVTGTTAAYAPTSFSATATCTVAGAPVTLPSGGVLTLAQGNGVPYSARLDGIPVGASCSIVEGATDASSTVYAPANGAGTAAVVGIGTAAAPAASVPLAQRATITNQYDATSLRIVKEVETDAEVGSFGPFDFTLSCSADTGAGTVSVPLAVSDAAFTLADGEQKVVTDLPVSADCRLTETDADGADRITIAATTSTVVVEGQAAIIALGPSAEYVATVTNRYEAGRLSVSKDAQGDGEDGFGDGEFSFDVECTYNGDTVLEESITLFDGETHDFTTLLPKDTQCSVVETDAGGATTPAPDASVVIPGPASLGAYGHVTAGMTNLFENGALRVVKSRTGDGAASYGAGPFVAQVECTWQRSGETLTIPLPDGGLVTLDAAGGYEATITGLIGGAECIVTEPGPGGATATTVGSVSPATIPVDGESTVTITNRFDVGSLVIVKERIGEGVDRYGAGPFTVAVECGYDHNGVWTALDLGADATQQLSAGNGYRAQLDGLLAGAECSVTETDAGLAITSATTPVDGTVEIVADDEVEVTVTNTFLLGWLQIVKTASQPIVEGGTDFSYTLAVTNPGHVDAAGVTVTDDIPAVLAVTTVDAAGWTCDVTGTDIDGYGGTLDCSLDTGVLLIDATAPDIVVNVSVLPTISQDEIDNTAIVDSTTPQVDGDDDDEQVEVRWLEVATAARCELDAPWLDFAIAPHNLDIDGETLAVEWIANGGAVVHTDTLPLSGAGPVVDSLLFPGAAVDADGNGVLWPGWRPVLAGETPDWENLVLDTTLPEYGLRSGGQVRFMINPERTLTLTYPPATQDCVDTPTERDAELTLLKTASTTWVPAGGRFDYTMQISNTGLGAVTDVRLEDPIPTVLKVISVTPVVPTDAAAPAWQSCDITDREKDGFGGLLTCVLDRPLGFGQSAPDIVLTVELSPRAAPGTIVNTAFATGTQVEPDLDRDLPTFALEDDAAIATAGWLASTGAAPAGLIAAAAALLILGFGLLVFARRRRTS